jgi:hypothetical protein
MLQANREASVERSAENAKYVVMSHRQNVVQNHNLLIGSKFFENVAKFKYLETPVTDQDFIHGEIMSRLNLGNTCRHSVQNLLSSRPPL